MKAASMVIVLLAGVASGPCGGSPGGTADFSAVSRVDSGSPVAVMLTSYSTTLRATEETGLRSASPSPTVRKGDHLGQDSIRIYIVARDASPRRRVKILPDGGRHRRRPVRRGEAGARRAHRMGYREGRIRARPGEGGSPIGHSVPGVPRNPHDSCRHRNEEPTSDQLPPTTKPIGRMIGADISFLPQIENGAGRFSQGSRKFSENGTDVDAIALLKPVTDSTPSVSGFSCIRRTPKDIPRGGILRAGLHSQHGSSGQGGRTGVPARFPLQRLLGGPSATEQAAGLGRLDYSALRDSVRSYTTSVLGTLERQGTPPDMVQIGNEINHGLLWPDGHIGNLINWRDCSRQAWKGPKP